MKGLFDDLEKPTKRKPNEQDLQWADQLRQAVIKDRRRVQAWNRIAWANQFRILREELSQDLQRVDKVLTWFCENIGKEYTPEAFCGETFRKKFDRMEKAMARTAPSVVVSDKALQVCELVRHRHWPKGSASQLPAVAQASLDNLSRLHQGLHALAVPINGDYRWVPYAEAALSNLQLSSVDLVAQWLLAVSGRIANWETWSGDLRYFTFSRSHKDFQARGREWMDAYCGNPNVWDKLMEAIDDSGTA